MREFACIADGVACTKVKIVISGLAPKLDIVAPRTAPIAKQCVFGLCFIVGVFRNVIDIRDIGVPAQKPDLRRGRLIPHPG